MQEDNQKDEEPLSQEPVADDVTSQNLADILGADEQETNLTSIVDAVLDDDEDLPDDVSEDESSDVVLAEDMPEGVSEMPLSESSETDIPSFFKEDQDDSLSVETAEDVLENESSEEVSLVENDVLENIPVTEQKISSDVDIQYQKPSNGNMVLSSEKVLWHLLPREKLSDNPFILNKNSGFMFCEGNKKQIDLKIDVEKSEEATLWRLFVSNNSIFPLQSGVTEINIDKRDDVIRYVSLMEKGVEKIRMFNQNSFRFLSSQDGFLSAQGNIICGQVSEAHSLLVHDYQSIPLRDKLNQVLFFDTPVSGFVCGPNNVCVFFANIKAIIMSVQDFVPQNDIVEYLPSLKNFDTNEYFVFDPADDEKEFIARGKQKNLMLNVGSSLYSWNVRFDNEMYMSLRDALEYQRKYKKIPSSNGVILFGTRQFRFFNVEKLQIRTKVTYYAYGRL